MQDDQGGPAGLAGDAAFLGRLAEAQADWGRVPTPPAAARRWLDQVDEAALAEVVALTTDWEVDDLIVRADDVTVLNVLALAVHWTLLALREGVPLASAAALAEQRADWQRWFEERERSDRRAQAQTRTADQARQLERRARQDTLPLHLHAQLNPGDLDPDHDGDVA